MHPDKLTEEVQAIARAGLNVSIVENHGQCYVMVRSLEVPSPPWESPSHDILIAIPAAYDAAGLDGFYLRLPYKFNSGSHPRVNGGTIQLENGSWQLVSWHYPDGKPWKSGKDSLSTHITHCRGFFYHRGATNDYH